MTSEAGITVADAGAVLHGVAGCADAADGSVFCPPLAPTAKDRRDGLDAPLQFAHIGVYLGGGDDVAVVSLHRVDADGVLTCRTPTSSRWVSAAVPAMIESPCQPPRRRQATATAAMTRSSVARISTAAPATIT